MSRNNLRDIYRKIIGLSSLIMLLGVSFIEAQTMDAVQATSWASRWFAASHGSFKEGMQEPKIEFTGAGRGNICLADFGETGFVIFSNEGAPIVLGYSFEDGLPSDKNHPLYTEWLPSYSVQVAESSRLKNTSGLNNNNYDIPGFDEYYEPIVQTKWGQGSPWNMFCPSDTNDHHAPVGCVAVALAQIMKKWDWPEKGYGQNSYIPSAHREYGIVEAVFDTTFYHWDEMHSTIPTEAAALLLFHTGVATNMNYAPNESGANSSVWAKNAMVSHFGYNSDMIFREKEAYNYNDWTQLIRQDIVNGRPVMYRGSDPESGLGHAFVIDGFRDEYFFHFNWGWNGWGDGYYRLEAMADGGGNYTKGQAGLFGIQPVNKPQHDRPFALKAMAGDGFVQLFWDEPLVNDLSHYNVYRNGELIAYTADTRYRDEDLMNGEDYVYFLTAEYVGDDPGVSDPTPEHHITPWESMILPYSQDFEDSLAGWQIGGTETSYRWTDSDSLEIGGNDSKFIAIRSDLAGPGNKVTDYLISPVLDLREMSGAAIKFDYLFQQVEHVDYLFLMFRRFDNGLWYPIFRLDSTESWSDWTTYYGYFPDDAKNTLIQLGFFYTDYNGVGKGAALDNIEIFNVEDIPVPDFAVDTALVCQYETIIVSDSTKGPADHWWWDFGEGAEPGYAEGQGPHQVKYLSGGKKDIHLMVNHLDHIIKEDYVDISWETRADFSYERDYLTITFTNLSEHPQFVHWDFGDGSTSTELSPVYQYKSKLEFDVEMVSFSPPCFSDTMRMHLDLRNGTGFEKISFDNTIRVYPNPASGNVNISWNNTDSKIITVDLINSGGSFVKSFTSSSIENHLFDISGIISGFYWLRIRQGDMLTHRKLIISN